MCKEVFLSFQALGCTVRLGPATSIDDALHTLAQRVSDSMPSVRSCLVDILADWLLHQPDRYMCSSHNNIYVHVCALHMYM